MSTYVIADIGSCHDGRPSLMFAAVDVAKAAGADAIKFQWVSDPDRMAARRGRATADGYADVYRRYLAFPHEFLGGLAMHCSKAGIDFMCTAFLPQDVAVVAQHVARFKVASFEATDWALLAAHAGYGKPVLVSTGMCSADEIGGIRQAGRDHGLDLRLLHCVSSYPAPINALNLAQIRTLGLDGFSDHAASQHLASGALAVAAGATILEAHLRLDETDRENPDYAHALGRHDFGRYVELVRLADAAMGTGFVQRRPACEDAMRAYRVT